MKHRPNLGERITAVESIRSGRTTPEEVALQFDLLPADVRSWLTLHANDRTVDLAKLRGELRGESGRLSHQALRLRHLIASAERTLHDLHAQLLSRKLA